jgi:carboxylesterase type B
MRLIFVVAVASASAAAPPIGAFPSPVLQLPCGPVSGVVQLLPDNTPVAAFLGLPYALPPVGPLRWEPPVAAPCWAPGTTFNASVQGNTCVQPSGSGDEDCLTLSLYIPCGPPGATLCTLPSPSSRLPVFTYIHGGGLMSGSGTGESPQVFANRTGTMAIALNYRLNIFGFLATSALTSTSPRGTSGNYGILDQQLALTWIQANAASVGGDPSRVTVAGQSSGGTSIFALLSSAQSRGLFSAAISLSGSPNVSISLADAELQNAAVSPALGCSDPSNATAEVECLRAKTPAELVAVLPPSWDTPGIWGLPTDPTGAHYAGLPVIDGKVLTVPFAAALEAGLVDVPLLISSMAQESTAPATLTTVQEWQAMLTSTFSPWPNSSAPALAVGTYDQYLAEALLDVDRAYSSVNADVGLACANREVAARAKLGGLYTSPIYVAVNQWQASVPLEDGPTRNRTSVFHTLDYKVAFENWPTPADPAAVYPGPLDVAHARFLQGAWGQLLWTGRLNSSLTAGWASVEAVPGFPEGGIGVQLISAEQLPPFQPNQFNPVQGKEKCAFWASFGFDSRWWWCD